MGGYIYVFSNPTIPKLLKIGFTYESPETRLKQLNTTGVASSFVLELCLLVNKPDKIEKLIHERLSGCRYSQNREFFEVSVKAVHEALFAIVCEQEAHISSAGDIGKIDKGHDLNESEVHILQLLVSAGSAAGVTQFRLSYNTKYEDLTLEIHLSNLFSKKFVTRRRESDHEIRWLCTPQGVKFLSDHGLIAEWMRNKDCLSY